MARSVPEWIGKSADSAIPPRVRLRVWDRCGGKCGQCNRKIGPADSWIVEHLTAIINGGENREKNLGITCGWCKPSKDAADVAIKSKTARVRAAHLGIRPPSRLRGAGFQKAAPQRSASRPIIRKSERTDA